MKWILGCLAGAVTIKKEEPNALPDNPRRPWAILLRVGADLLPLVAPGTPARSQDVKTPGAGRTESVAQGRFPSPDQNGHQRYLRTPGLSVESLSC